ncbi:GNAT family N-acetyltransferase [Streptomyces sp. NPDC059631]|uniref:GNAT family N-acetyltransferase n=1 Tax=unclassified Streptomyces TaxID=2593676 RepID=UPI0036CED896
MTEKPIALRAAEVFQAAVETLAGVVPDGFHERGPGGSLLAFTGSQIAALNGILSVDPASAAPAEIELLSTRAEQRGAGLPWSIRLRGEPEEKIVRIAADHGLTTITRQPFMLLPLTDGSLPVPETVPDSVRVRPLGGDEHETFATVLGGAFGAPPAIISGLYTPAVLDQPFLTAYVAEVEGVPAAAGLSIVTDQHVGLVNIGTLPAYRRRGIGRAVTGTILREASAAGAHTAYLHSTDEAVPLFAHLGFRTEESWTAFTA